MRDYTKATDSYFDYYRRYSIALRDSLLQSGFTPEEAVARLHHYVDTYWDDRRAFITAESTPDFKERKLFIRWFDEVKTQEEIQELVFGFTTESPILVKTDKWYILSGADIDDVVSCGIRPTLDLPAEMGRLSHVVAELRKEYGEDWIEPLRRRLYYYISERFPDIDDVILIRWIREESYRWCSMLIGEEGGTGLIIDEFRR